MTESLEDHKIVSEKEWIKARKSLLKKEKEFTSLIQTAYGGTAPAGNGL